MTLFAVMQAGLFPLLHLGRPWFFYWLIPYPATMQVWPNFKSALPWDAAAVFTYFTVSLLFWYLGLVPDLAALRDRAPRALAADRLRRLRARLARLGAATGATTGSSTACSAGWRRRWCSRCTASCRSDFAIAQLPGWHSTIFPPYFVAGAIFSGFAMVLTLMIPIRRVFGFGNVITDRHLDNICKMILVTGWIVIYSYVCEFFLAWYSGETSEMYTMFHGLPTGPELLGVLGDDVLQRRRAPAVLVPLVPEPRAGGAGCCRS